MKVPNSVPRFFAEAARKHCVSSAQGEEIKTEWYPSSRPIHPRPEEAEKEEEEEEEEEEEAKRTTGGRSRKRCERSA